jgi:hypothetical protein
MHEGLNSMISFAPRAKSTKRVAFSMTFCHLTLRDITLSFIGEA